jgi:branched-chain amino acid aminotransferase
LVTPSIRHIPPECLDPKIKYRSRLHWHLAETQSRLVDPKSTPLLLDLQGNITECAGANVLLAKDGAILSPTLRNILPGVSRKVVIELATKLSIPFKEQDLQLYDIMNADEAFLSSTPFGLCPATRINGRPVGSGKPGPVWRRLMDAWSELVGLDAVRQVLAALPTS